MLCSFEIALQICHVKYTHSLLGDSAPILSSFDIDVTHFVIGRRPHGQPNNKNLCKLLSKNKI